MLRGIPPRTSTGGGGHHLRSTDPVRYRTGISRVREVEYDTAPWQVKPVPRQAKPANPTINIGPRPPLCCADCGGTGRDLAGARCGTDGLQVECLSCGGWHLAKKKAEIEDQTGD